jgi:hypothetical protein
VKIDGRWRADYRRANPYKTGESWSIHRKNQGSQRKEECNEKPMASGICVFMPATSVSVTNADAHESNLKKERLPLERPERCAREVLRFFQDLPDMAFNLNAAAEQLARSRARLHGNLGSPPRRTAGKLGCATAAHAMILAERAARLDAEAVAATALADLSSTEAQARYPGLNEEK